MQTMTATEGKQEYYVAKFTLRDVVLGLLQTAALGVPLALVLVGAFWSISLTYVTALLIGPLTSVAVIWWLLLINRGIGGVYSLPYSRRINTLLYMALAIAPTAVLVWMVWHHGELHAIEGFPDGFLKIGRLVRGEFTITWRMFT